tara:strand:+ start:119 stop:595 length:477 start_codon:yes stop_codon:yes gene_type:complete
MDRLKSNIKNNNLRFDEKEQKWISNQLDKDDFNIINHLVDNEYSKLMNFEDELKSIYEKYEPWGKKFRTNIQERYRLLLDEVESEKHQIEKIGEFTNKIQNQYTKFHWKLPHDQIKEQLTEEELEKLGYFGDYELIQKLLETTKEHIKNKPYDNQIKV